MRIEKLLGDIDNVSIDTEATHEGQPAKEVFCQYWADAKRGLDLLSAIVKNPIVKWIVIIVISLGDSVSEKVCPKG